MVLRTYIAWQFGLTFTATAASNVDTARSKLYIRLIWHISKGTQIWGLYCRN